LKKTLTPLLLFLSINIFSQDYKVIPGEKIDFLVSFGIFNAGEASMLTGTELYSIDNFETIKIDVTGKSIGVFDLFTTVRDKWGVFITKKELEPKKFYKYLLEGKYRKNEVLNFVENSDSVQIEVLDKETKDFLEYKYLHFEDDIKKIIRSYFMNYWIASLAYLRSLDYSETLSKDLVEIPYFENNEKFSYQMKFLKRDTIETKIGNYNSLVFAPIIPKNKLFEEEDAVKFWLTDDDKKIPLKLEAKMNFGSFVIEVSNYSNVN
jgi:hypothetical protein